MNGSVPVAHARASGAETAQPRGQGAAGKRAARDQMVGRFIESLPGMRKVFEVRLDRQQRAAWRPLTIHQLEALVVLDRSSVTMRELCDELDISESAGTALSDRLVAQGFVERCADPNDRRVVRLTMSQQARAMAEQYRSVKHRHVADVLAVLEPEELASLVHICEQIVSRAGPKTGSTANARSEQEDPR